MPNTKLDPGVFWEGLRRYTAALAGMDWLKESDHTFAALDAAVQLASDLDHDGELEDSEQKFYGEVFEYVADFLLFIGGSGQAVAQFFSEESDDRGRRLAARIKESPDFKAKDDKDLINSFIAGGDAVETVSEAIAEELDISEDVIEEKIEIRFKGGKMTRVKKRVKKLAANIKAKLAKGLRKVKHKAFNAAAMFKRAKSLRKRKARGL